MEDLKLGIIGTNFVSDWLCDAVKETDGIENSAVYSRTHEKGSEFAAKHGIGCVYTDMDEFLCSDIDAVYIASPNKFHYEYAMKAVKAGKHVLLEKPATLTMDEFKSLKKSAGENGVVVLEAMRPVHDPALEMIREAIPKIGTLRRAVFDFCQYSSRYDRFKKGEILNAFTPSLGNAAVMDIGVYAVEVCVALFGMPKDIFARSVKLSNGFEGMGSVFFHYGDFQAEVVYSKITDSFNPSVITGEDGYISIGKLSMMGYADVKMRNGSEETLFRDRFSGSSTNMVYEVGDFEKAVRGELDVKKYHEYTEETLKIIDEIRKQNGIDFGGSI